MRVGQNHLQQCTHESTDPFVLWIRVMDQGVRWNGSRGLNVVVVQLYVHHSCGHGS